MTLGDGRGSSECLHDYHLAWEAGSDQSDHEMTLGYEDKRLTKIHLLAPTVQTSGVPALVRSTNYPHYEVLVGRRAGFALPLVRGLLLYQLLLRLLFNLA